MIRLISNERGDTPLVEAYRTLRSNLQYVCNQHKCKLICITAATSGEGTSEVAANTALALSKNNNKVLLVDGNLRNPTQHIAFNVQNKGLTNAVMMDEDLTIHRNVVPHLDVLTAGEVVEYPSDIVDSSKLPAIFEYVRDEYDVVIIDTPPVLSVTDAVVLAEKSDGVILVVKNEVAPSGSIKRYQLSEERIYGHDDEIPKDKVVVHSYENLQLSVYGEHNNSWRLAGNHDTTLRTTQESR